MEGIWLWVSFALISAATHIPRGSFIVIGERARLPPLVQEALRYAPAAALAAIITPDLLVVDDAFNPFNAKLAAAACAIAVALKWRNPWLPFIVGMGALLLMRNGLGA